MVENIKYMIGVDEVGRGPLAGPLTVAAIAFRLSKIQLGNLMAKRALNTRPQIFENIKDSKKLSFKKREEWYNNIKYQISNIKTTSQNSKIKIFLATSSVSNQIIDKIGITKATDLAVKQVIKNLRKKVKITPFNSYFLLDGLLKAPKIFSQKTIIKGDERVPIISAASIVAKVSRDRKMLRFHKKFPYYGFDKHKGYGTSMHRGSIEKYGLSEIHRETYCKFLSSKLKTKSSKSQF